MDPRIRHAAAPSRPARGEGLARRSSAVAALLLVAGLAACGTAPAVTSTVGAPRAPAGSSPSATPTSSSLAAGSEESATSTEPASAAPANVWSATVDPTAIPLGDGKVSTSPAVGQLYSCTTRFTGGGAEHAGGWIDAAAGTWDSEAKVQVQGSVTWEAAAYTEAVSGPTRVITTNDLPISDPTGNFPIARTDPAFSFDRNPNSLQSQSFRYSLPANPAAASTPGCLPLGPIGVFTNGVVLYDALDAGGRDAAAHETQDLCDGHPDGHEAYHYHSVASCIEARATGSSTLVGYAFDGYGIYVERDASGNLPTDADLDACHGRVSEVMWNGTLTSIYHYDATLEYPYTVGCFHGASALARG